MQDERVSGWFLHMNLDVWGVHGQKYVVTLYMFSPQTAAKLEANNYIMSLYAVS